MPYLATRWQGMPGDKCRGTDGKFPPLSKSPIITAKRHPRFVEAGRNLSRPGREPGSLSRHSFTPSFEGSLTTAVWCRGTDGKLPYSESLQSLGAKRSISREHQKSSRLSLDFLIEARPL